VTYEWLRNLLFRLEPERAHSLTLKLLPWVARTPLLSRLGGCVPDRPCQVMGIRFPNPVGLAAGLDKDGRCIDGLAALGFGFLEIGTVTPRAQAGNPQPRMFRLPAAQALINRMGFNNNGVERLAEHVRHARYSGILGINIGKNKDTPMESADADYLTCLRAVYAAASYVAVNVSSPNTPGLRDLQHGESLNRLLASLKSEQNRLAEAHGRYVPLAVKIAPDLGDSEIRSLAKAFVDHGMDGVIATNTTNDRASVSSLAHGNEAGGLSGAPLRARALSVLECLCDALDGELPVIAVGGIMSGEDARARFDAGASLVQVYTGLIFRGPGLIREIAAAAP